MCPSCDFRFFNKPPCTGHWPCGCCSTLCGCVISPSMTTSLFNNLGYTRYGTLTSKYCTRGSAFQCFHSNSSNVLIHIPFFCYSFLMWLIQWGCSILSISVGCKNKYTNVNWVVEIFSYTYHEGHEN